MKIQSIHAYEIISSGGTPSLEVKVELNSGTVGIASVPYGASAGSFEAYVLFDGDKARYKGKGMLKAVANINEKIAPELVGQDADDQRSIDGKMSILDGTENKSNLGGNAILGASLAVAHATANEHKLPLYQWIRKSFDLKITDFRLPNPMIVSIEGGKHADNSTDLQEYLLSPIGNISVRENIRMGIETYFNLKEILAENNYSTNVGNEGAFAPDGIVNNEKPLQMMFEAITRTGLTPGKDIGLSIDAAANEFFKNDMYHLNVENRQVSAPELMTYFETWLQKYPILTVEDMLAEDAWADWTIFNTITQKYGISNIGDDLTVTNTKRLQKAIDAKAITAILIKLNQIGTLTETVDCCTLAREHGMMTVPSHRGGGETNDTSMVDLAVALNSGFIKVGPTRGERVSKYNRLLEIERELGDKAKPMGNAFNQIF